MNNDKKNEIYFAGGCVWGVQEFCRYLPGVVETEAGRANGSSDATASPYDGYAECVRMVFDESSQSVAGLLPYFFEVIDPYSMNKQGDDTGVKYRTGIYSRVPGHLKDAQDYINARADAQRIVVEVMPLVNFVPSDAEHQDRLLRCPDDICHIDQALLHKYRYKRNTSSR